MIIDMVASEPHYLRHMLPVWWALPADLRGNAMVWPELVPLARAVGLEPVPWRRVPDRALLAAGWRDARDSRHAKLVLMEHGVGQTYVDGGSYFAGGANRQRVDLFLCPNAHAQQANQRANPDKPCVVIGTPAMDPWHRGDTGRPGNGVTTISFHWQPKGGPPETGSALFAYAHMMEDLSHARNVWGHAHPRIVDLARKLYGRHHLPLVPYVDVLNGTDVYVCDNSSTLFEIASLDRPVVVLNAAYMRRDVHHGLRFWTYADVGVQCDDPAHLLKAIDQAFDDTPAQQARRMDISGWLYPFRGYATARAVDVLEDFLRTW